MELKMSSRMREIRRNSLLVTLLEAERQGIPWDPTEATEVQIFLLQELVEREEITIDTGRQPHLTYLGRLVGEAAQSHALPS